MEFIKTKLEGLLIIQPKVFGDNRGCFFESFSQQLFEQNGVIANFVQDNQSISKKGVVRGLHLQAPPYAQAKLVRVVHGAAQDVAVDIRKNSPTYGQYVSVRLDTIQNNMFWIPRGFAHGFVALEDDTVFVYKTDNYYNKASEMAIRWDDPTLNIDWNIKQAIVSEKDNENPFFKDFISPF